MKLASIPFLLLIFSLYHGAAATYYVATNGNDSADGSIGTPWLRITNSLPKIAGGDTLNIRGGFYAEKIPDLIPSGSSWGTATVVQGYAGETATLNPVLVENDSIIRFVADDTHYIIINNLTLDGVGLTNGGDCIKVTDSGGDPAHHIRVSNCTIKNAYDGHNILLSGHVDYTPTYCEITNCIISRAGYIGDDDPAKHGIYVSTSSNTFDNCTIVSNLHYGIKFQYFRPSGNTVKNCRFIGHHLGDVSGWGALAIGLLSGTNNQIFNNTFDGHYFVMLVYPGDPLGNSLFAFNTCVSNFSGVSLEIVGTPSDFGTFTFVNNLVTDGIATNLYALNLYPGVSTNNSIQVSNNVICGSGTKGRIWDSDGLAVSANNLTNQANAGLVNPSYGNFKLLSSSVARLAGVWNGITTDAIGNTRGNPPDAGAFQFIPPTVTALTGRVGIVRSP